jgi:hypothetical protein
MNNEKLKVVKNMNLGDLFLALNGKEYIFLKLENGTIIGKLGEKHFRVPVSNFVRLIRKNADPDLAQKSKKREELLEAIIGILKTLKLGDKVICTDNQVYTFIKLNKKKFVARLGDDIFNVPIGMFGDLVERVKPDPELETKKARIRPFFGREIQTSWGPSVVKRLNDEETHVILYEFGEERFDLKLDDFLSEIETYGER